MRWFRRNTETPLIKSYNYSENWEWNKLITCTLKKYVLPRTTYISGISSPFIHQTTFLSEDGSPVMAS